MMAEAPRVPANHAAPTPAAPPNAKANNQTGKKGAFRETAWFKRGEIEEEMAKAQAAAGDNALKSGVTGQHIPVDESQVDLSAQDRDRLSLKTGATQAMPVIKAPVQALPGERMDEAEMLAELNPSRKYFLIAGAIVLAVVLGAGHLLRDAAGAASARRRCRTSRRRSLRRRRRRRRLRPRPPPLPPTPPTQTTP